MRRAVTVAVALCATGSTASAGPRPEFAKLPLAPTVADAPSPPTAIAATERVAGVAVKSGRHFDGEFEKVPDAAPAEFVEDVEEAGARWLTIVVDRACLSPLGGSEATRHQIIAAEGGVSGFTRARMAGATLELDTVWVDSRSRGVRAVPTARIRLERVAGTPSGLNLYAYRSTKALELVAVAPRGAHLSAFSRDENRFSQCNLLQVSIPVSRAATAVDFGAELPLPASDEDRKHAERGLPVVPRTKLWSAHASLSRTRSDRAPVLSFLVRDESPLGMAVPAPALR